MKALLRSQFKLATALARPALLLIAIAIATLPLSPATTIKIWRCTAVARRI